MNTLELEFEKPAWEVAIEAIPAGKTMSASGLLSLLESEDDSEAEAALQALCQKRITLSIADLQKYSVGSEFGERLAFEEKLVKGENWTTQLEENDPLRIYLDELAQIPAAGDPDLLAMEIASGNEFALNSLVNLMLSRVIDAAPEYAGRGVLLMDLIQEGSLGLWQGLQTYRSGNISAHCDWWIRQYMASAIAMQARASGVGQKMRRAMEDYRDIDQKLLAELGRNPTVEEMAQALHMTPQQISVVAETLANAQLLQRAKAPEKPEQELQEEELAVEDTAYFQMRQRIAELLSVLPEEDARLLSLRYGLEGGVPMKPHQVALRLGITPDEVTNREAEALMKIRQAQ